MLEIISFIVVLTIPAIVAASIPLLFEIVEEKKMYRKARDVMRNIRW